jgi:hypothetical protein
MATRLAHYVEHSAGCSRWIIGNETNLPREWPKGQPILPLHYAECYLGCRAAIHALPGHERDEVLIAGPGPWNNELHYAANKSGDWVHYFEDVLEIVGRRCDGFALHAYTHGYDPALVTSEARMDAPFGQRHFEFRVYQDFLGVVPPELRQLPVYLTEANGNGPWQARGLMPAMLQEISQWNEKGGQHIFYRYPRYDDFYMEGKPDVIAEFQTATQQTSSVPQRGNEANTVEHQTFVHIVSTGPTLPLPERKISEDFKRRVPQITFVAETPGKTHYRLTKAEYVPNGATRFGPDHHMLVEVLGTDGKRKMGAPVNFYWGSGNEITPINKVKEPYGADFGMSNAGHSFGVWVGNFREASDDVFGMGLGKIGSEQMGEHVTYYLEFQEVEVPAASLPAPVTGKPPTTVVMPILVHPVASPRYRAVTQAFGVNGDYYRRFSVDGVPLKGHNGIDLGTPVGTPISAVDDGRVLEAADDPTGWGLYVKLAHAWGESLYAHLSANHLQVGEIVSRGEYIGNSGNTGNRTGPHLHFGIRIYPYNRRDGWGGFTDPEPYLLNTGASQPAPSEDRKPSNLVALIKATAVEVGVDWQLLASLVWAESSFRQDVESTAGAMGLAQIMPTTWAEWAPKMGAKDPYSAVDNLKVGAAYLRWLLDTLRRNEREAIVAYNFGIGNVMAGRTPPEETEVYAEKVIHGADLLRAVEG